MVESAMTPAQPFWRIDGYCRTVGSLKGRLPASVR
jgi:hypothetical protein